MNLRDKLRQETREAHEALELRLTMTTPGLTIERYIDYLDCLLPFYTAIQRERPAAAQVCRALPSCKSRIEWLHEDLSYFGRESKVKDNIMRLLPSLTAVPEGVGVSYVVEGATLGARALYAELHAEWSLEPGRGGSFLFGYGAQTGRRWKHFVEELNRLALGDEGENRSISAARQTFAGLDAWFALNGWHAPRQCVPEPSL